ncbi:MAG: hypothetical protein JWM32_833 [Verrucomicrobia bacterium]|nr:hypothetical protein [Verrucomicrobiota bacterium]
MDQPANDPPPPRRRGWRRFSRVTLITVAVIVVVLVAARIAMPYVMRSAINARLAKIPDYTGWVDQVNVSVIRGAYSLHGVVVQKTNGQVKEPYFRADQVDFSIAWRELARGKLVADIELDKPILNFVQAESTEASQVAADSRWQEAVNDIFPIDITWLKINDGQVRYINNAMTPKVDVRVAHMHALATGLRNRVDEAGNEFPARLALEGETIGGGTLKIAAQAEPLADEPHFLLKLELERVSLPAMNEFLRAYGNVDVSKGLFSGYVEVVARNGHFQGYFKPFFDQVDFSASPGDNAPTTQRVWEWFVRSFAWVFKNHARDEVATRIPFEGETKDLKVSIWETIRTLLRHAFIQPLQKKLDSKAPGGVGAQDEMSMLPKDDAKERKLEKEPPKSPTVVPRK